MCIKFAPFIYITLKKIGANKVPDIRIMVLALNALIFSWKYTKKKNILILSN